MSNIMSIINKFNFFRELNQQLINNVKLFYLNKYYLLFTTFNDLVYQFKLSDKQLKN